jgi:hypothetical protein
LTTKREPVSATFLRKDADLDAPRDYEVAGNFGLAVQDVALGVSPAADAPAEQ